MHKPHTALLPSPALPADKIADRLRAHAQLCQQVARASWNESIAAELVRLAAECLEVADNLGPGPGTLRH